MYFNVFYKYEWDGIKPNFKSWWNFDFRGKFQNKVEILFPDWVSLRYEMILSCFEVSLILLNAILMLKSGFIKDFIEFFILVNFVSRNQWIESFNTLRTSLFHVWNVVEVVGKVIQQWIGFHCASFHDLVEILEISKILKFSFISLDKLL